MVLRQIKAGAVFCGSNFGASEVYADGARQLGIELARTNITLIYGGTTKGLMGVVADAVLNAGGTVHGVITDRLHQRGHSHAGLSRHEIVTTLRNRKERMAELADAFIAMPGGIGTVEELMEVWTMNQLSEIDKPVGLLDVANFFAPFLAFIDRPGRNKIFAGRAPPFHLRGCRGFFAGRKAPVVPAERCAEMALTARSVMPFRHRCIKVLAIERRTWKQEARCNPERSCFRYQARAAFIVRRGTETLENTTMRRLLKSFTLATVTPR
jgi:uncharacterized protein (TIGR00730 family)